MRSTYTHKNKNKRRRERANGLEAENRVVIVLAESRKQDLQEQLVKQRSSTIYPTESLKDS